MSGIKIRKNEVNIKDGELDAKRGERVFESERRYIVVEESVTAIRVEINERRKVSFNMRSLILVLVAPRLR